jgi:hypothetical protein
MAFIANLDASAAERHASNTLPAPALANTLEPTGLSAYMVKKAFLRSSVSRVSRTRTAASSVTPKCCSSGMFLLFVPNAP